MSANGRLLPFCMFGFGLATGFVLRDEMTFPSYMRIKTAVVEHSVLTRRKLDPDLFAIIDPNTGKQLLKMKREQIEKDHERKLNEI